MANLGKWTAAARDSESNSVIAAVPAQSHEDIGDVGTYFDLGTGSIVEVIFAGGLLGLVALNTSFRRLKNRKGRLGNRDVNDRVAILFYPDRVDLHNRAPVMKKVGKHLESHPISEVERPDASTITVAGIRWHHSPLERNELESALAEADIQLPT